MEVKKFKHNVRTVFQELNGLYPIGDKMLTEDELEKLIQLMPDTQWIIIRWHSPQDFHDIQFLPDGRIVDCGKLTEQTLRKIVDDKPLEREGFEDIVNSFNQE